MAFLLKVRFDKKGCSTDPNIKNLGGVSFTETSSLRNGENVAFFEPEDDNAGLQITNDTLYNITNALGEERAEFGIYFRYKVKQDRLTGDLSIPIISYLEPITGENLDFVSIEDGNHFVFYLKKDEFYSTKNIEYTFDGEWHTLVISKNSSYIKFFVDGFLNSTNPADGTIPIKNSTAIYIGCRSDNAKSWEHVSTFAEGSLDDICITDLPVYMRNFVPPNMYFVGDDTKENYWWGLAFGLENTPKFIQEAVERKMCSTAFHINEKQKGWLPRRLRIQWHEEDAFFKHQEYYRMNNSRTYTALTLFGLEQPLLMEPDNRFIDPFNAEVGVNDGLIYPFMLFVDKKFIKLSDITIQKCDQYYTVFIKDREPDKYNMIKTVELVIIPFPVIYEEEMGERENLRALYVFDQDGKFNPANGFTYYYIDKDKCPDMGTTGVYEYNVPISGGGTSGGITPGTPGYEDSMMLQSYWRYGNFIKTSEDSSYIYANFQSTDGLITKAGDKVNIFKNTTLVDTRRYDIVGDNLFRFSKHANMVEDLFDRSITLQYISDSRSFANVYQDMTSMREVSIKATKDKQSSFTIPTVVDSDGFLYRNFLVFRGTVCLNGQDRFHISADKKKLILNDTEDFLEKDSGLTFIFLKLTKSDQYGTMHVLPIYLYARTGGAGEETTPSGKVTSVVIPDINGLKFTKANLMMFVNGAFVSPDRYEIIDNKRVVLNDPNYPRWRLDKGVTFVVLKMANELEDPTGPRGEIIKLQTQQGNRFILFDLNVDSSIQLTLDNFVVFDQEGRYLPEIIGEVYNMGIVKAIKSSIDPLHIVPRYLTCVYSSDKSLPNESNIVSFANKSFIKDYIRLYQEFYEMDLNFDKFIADFNTHYSHNLHYGENLAKSLNYIMEYNETKFKDVYKKKSQISRIKLDTSRINEKIKAAGIMGPITMDRDEFISQYQRTFSIFFVDGLIPYWQGFIEYDQNQLKLRFKDSINPDSSVEVLRFKGMNETILEPLDNQIIEYHI